MNRYLFRDGRWYYSHDGGVSWYRTPYNVQHAPAPEYRATNPKIDLFSDAGRYIASTNWHRTCRDAFAWYATNAPEKGVRIAQRSRR